MKKKATKKTVKKPKAKPLARRKSTKGPGKVGGKKPDAKLTWAKIGRKRLDDDSSIQELGAELKAIREQKRISLAAMSKQLDVAPATIIKFEDRGYPVSVKIVHELAKKLGYKLTLTAE